MHYSRQQTWSEIQISHGAHLRDRRADLTLLDLQVLPALFFLIVGTFIKKRRKLRCGSAMTKCKSRNFEPTFGLPLNLCLHIKLSLHREGMPIQLANRPWLRQRLPEFSTSTDWPNKLHLVCLCARKTQKEAKNSLRLQGREALPCQRRTEH